MDITVQGSGIWLTIHLLALHATTKPLKDAYILMMTLLCDNFGCETCKPDFKLYISNIKKYYHVELGLFKWSVDLHNSVNQKLNKPEVSFDTALLKYKNLVCVNCDQQTKKEVKILVPLEQTGFNIKSFY